MRSARIRIPISALGPDKVVDLSSLLDRYPGDCPLEFELLRNREYRIHVIPREGVSVNPAPTFVEEVEKLFGDNSVTLYT